MAKSTKHQFYFTIVPFLKEKYSGQILKIYFLMQKITAVGKSFFSFLVNLRLAINTSLVIVVKAEQSSFKLLNSFLYTFILIV